MAQVQKDSSTWSAINTTVWDIVNPITNIGAQFFGGPFSYPTYWRMATKGIANVDPFFISRFLSFIPKYAYNHAINPGLKAMGWDQGVNRFFKSISNFTNKFKLPYVSFNKDYGFMLNPNSSRIREKLIKNFEKELTKAMTQKHPSPKYIAKIEKKLMGAKALPAKTVFNTLLKGGIKAFGLIGLAYTTYDIVKTVGEGLNFLHEMSVNLAQDIEAKRQHMLKVDFNKPLYGGYLTAGAYTERQRAIRLLAKNPGLPQPFIGNEANRYMRRF